MTRHFLNLADAGADAIAAQGGGADIAVPEHEPAEQSSLRCVGRVVEIAVAVHEEQEHVSVSQIGAGRHAFGTIDAVLVSERKMPGRMLVHETQHAAGQLVVVDARITRRCDRMHGPRCGLIGEQQVLIPSLPLQPVE